MLNPQCNRLDYGKILAPKDGYSLDFAVGATYSLDLSALLEACMAFSGLSDEMDNEYADDPVCLYGTLSKTEEKVLVFCEAGQIHFPQHVKAKQLYILLEQMVCQVSVKRKGKYASFHPKFWLARYYAQKGNASNFYYRIVILSRNLTFDRNWDIAFYMDGEPVQKNSDRIKSKIERKNQPIADFLKFLVGYLNDASCENKKEKINSIKEELRGINFKIQSEEFENFDFEFMLTGIKKSDGGWHSILNCPLFSNFPAPKQKDELDEMMVMSPFLSKETVNFFNNRVRHKNKTALVTREHSLNVLEESDCDNFQIYTMKESIIDNSYGNSEEDDAEIVSNKNQDIHAKLYFTRKDSNVDLYFGSLNASDNAILNNVEFMVRLYSQQSKLKLKELTDSLCGEDEECPFRKIKELPESDDADSNNELNNLIKEICRTNPQATITKSKDNSDRYDVSIKFDFDSISDKFDSFTVKIKPLLTKKEQAISGKSRKIVFSSLKLMELSTFYAIAVHDVNNENQHDVTRVVKMPTKGMPKNREIEVSIIKDEASFYKYLSLLVGGRAAAGVLRKSVEENSNSSSNRNSTSISPALYEDLLEAAWSEPEKIKEIAHTTESLSAKGNVVPEDFARLIELINKAAENE